MFAVAMPLQMRATKSQIRVGAKPSIAIPIAEAAMLQSSTGRRPTRSESRPQIGMKRNCMMEKTAPGMVAMKSPAPRRRAMPGRNGITSPKPSRSRKIVRNSVPSEALRRVFPSTLVGAAAVIGLRLDRGSARLMATRARDHQAPVARRSARLAKT